MGYIYKITNLINGKMYIGQTTRTIEIRWREHIHDSQRDNYPIHLAIKKYGAANFKIEMLEECENNKLNEREIYWIKQYNTTNSDKGYNATSGGDANIQPLIDWIHNHPNEVKENLNKAREIAIKKFEDNPELKEKREKARIEGYKKYIEENREEWLASQRSKLEKAKVGFKKAFEENPEKIINQARINGKKTSRPVKQIDKETGLVIQIFDSCSEAARSVGHEGGHSNISKACKDSTKTAFGFKWAYA